MFKEFKEFALRGSVVDIAVGMLIGAGVSPIAKSLIDDIVMPPVGWLLGNADLSNLFLVIHQGSPVGPYLTIEAAHKAGAVTINYGIFTNTLLSFLVVVFVAFLMVKMINKVRAHKIDQETQEPTTKPCPFCLSTIPIKATKCPACTSAV